MQMICNNINDRVARVPALILLRSDNSLYHPHSKLPTSQEASTNDTKQIRALKFGSQKYKKLLS